MPPAQDHVWRYGVPFVSFMVASMYGLTFITQGKNDLKDAREAQVNAMLAEKKVVLPSAELSREAVARKGLLGAPPPAEEYEMKRIPR